MLDKEKTNYGLNPLKYIRRLYREAKNFKNVNIAVFGASVFWLIGGVLQMNLIIHSKNVYLLSNTSTGIVMSAAAIGIAVGSWLAGVLSGKTVKKGLIILGLSIVILLVFLKEQCHAQPCYMNLKQKLIKNKKNIFQFWMLLPQCYAV